MEQSTGKPTDSRSSLRETLIEDIRQVRHWWRERKSEHTKRRFRQDARDLYRFYLDEESRAELASMGRFKRAVLVTFWLLKSLLMKLSPGRRLAVFVSLLTFFLGSGHFQWSGGKIDVNLVPWGFILLLLVLMLELKDKLLAKDEIAIAREVQLALLPRRHPQLPGWSVWSFTQPANDVGGDLVDYIDLGGRGLGVALGDVAGKGLGAALLMAKLQATLRAIAPGCPSMGDLGSRLNTILERDGLSNRFATLFYCEFAAGSGRIRFLNAGHNPPLVRGGAGIRSLKASSIPIGVIAGSRYTEEFMDLEPGDTLLIYSDGLTEARNRAEEEFGEQRLRSVLAASSGLPPAEAGRRVLGEVEAFMQDGRPHDDLSLIVLERTA
ncbi:MAG: hypothetical protein DMF49_06715 [Acidobacteria bacterium]|nr:MAG: hypothetical protein DMF49_06715 [Acidobacteriota bacterium]